MKIHKINRKTIQFTFADYICEKCHFIHKYQISYNTDHLKLKLLPNIKCPSCKMSSNDTIIINNQTPPGIPIGIQI